MTTNKRVHLSYFIQYTNLVINAGSNKKNQLKESSLEKFDYTHWSVNRDPFRSVRTETDEPDLIFFAVLLSAHAQG